MPRLLWGFASPQANAGARVLAPSAEHLILFHLSRLKARQPRGFPDRPEWPSRRATSPPSFLAANLHDLWNGRVTRAHRLIDANAEDIRRGGRPRSAVEAEAAVAKFICGYIGCERQATRLFLAGLPPLFKVNIRRDSLGEWMQNTIRHLASEREPAAHRTERAACKARGGSFIIETLRRYMAELPRQRTGWLAAARDSAVGRALGAIHREPGARLDGRVAGPTSGCHAPYLRNALPGCSARRLSPISRARLQLGARLFESTDETVFRLR